jgi:hypothetical protein
MVAEAASPGRVTTMVLHRDGRHRLTAEGMPRADAERWAQEGFHVFVVAVRGGRWAFNCVGSGAVFTDLDRGADPGARAQEFQGLLAIEDRADDGG